MDALPGASADLQALAQRGVSRNYAKGRLLIEEGDLGDSLYIIVHGRLRAFSQGKQGREITFATYGPGDYVGEMSLDGGPRSASVEVVEACNCVVVTRATLEAFVAEHPSFAFELLAKVIRRARAATLSAKQMALNDVYGRLRHLFESHSVPGADGTRVLNERLTHLDIANRIGCSREMVSRLVKDLSNGGYLRSERGQWTLMGRIPPGW